MLYVAVALAVLYAYTGRLIFAVLAGLLFLLELWLLWATDAERIDAAERRGFKAGVLAARDHLARKSDPDSPMAPTDRRRSTEEEC